MGNCHRLKIANQPNVWQLNYKRKTNRKKMSRVTAPKKARIHLLSKNIINCWITSKAVKTSDSANFFCRFYRKSAQLIYILCALNFRLLLLLRRVNDFNSSKKMTLNDKARWAIVFAKIERKYARAPSPPINAFWSSKLWAVWLVCFWFIVRLTNHSSRNRVTFVDVAPVEIFHVQIRRLEYNTVAHRYNQ